MGKQEFNLVMSKVEEIAGAVMKFPDSAQGAICKSLVSALLHEGPKSRNGNIIDGGQESEFASPLIEKQAEVADRDYVAEIKRDFTVYNLNDSSDIEIAGYTAHYFIYVAPDVARVEAITKAHLEEVFAIAGRKPPKNFSDTLNNAKKTKPPLLESGRKIGSYKLTAIGRYQVENVMLKRHDQ